MKSTTQTLNIVIADSTAPGTRQFRIALNAEYDRCEGYYAIVNNDGGQRYFKMGLKDDTTTYQDLVNARHFQYQSGEYINPDHRFIRSTPFPAKGRTVTVTVETPDATSGDLDIDFVFLLQTGHRCETH